jgi:hypothetical protein
MVLNPAGHLTTDELRSPDKLKHVLHLHVRTEQIPPINPVTCSYPVFQT